MVINNNKGNKMTTRITSINLDGTIETKTTDTRTLKEEIK